MVLKGLGIPVVAEELTYIAQTQESVHGVGTACVGVELLDILFQLELIRGELAKVGDGMGLQIIRLKAVEDQGVIYRADGIHTFISIGSTALLQESKKLNDLAPGSNNGVLGFDVGDLEVDVKELGDWPGIGRGLDHSRGYSFGDVRELGFVGRGFNDAGPLEGVRVVQGNRGCSNVGVGGRSSHDARFNRLRKRSHLKDTRLVRRHHFTINLEGGT